MAVLQKLTGNTGGPVAPDGSSNINIVGSGSISVTGNPGTHTLTIADSDSSESTTYVDVSPYTVLLTDQILLVDSVDIGPSTILLPDSPETDGQTWTIKDFTGGSSTNPITVTTVSGATLIDGYATQVLANGYNATICPSTSMTVVWSLSFQRYCVIGQVSPTNINLPATTGSYGQTFIGGQNVITSPGNGNFFAGPLAGNTTLSGTENNAFGNTCLSNITTGSGNCAMGFGAMQLETTGSNNSAFGFNTLQSCVGVNNNVAVGFQAGMHILATSTDNVGIGVNALGSNADAQVLNYNVAIGSNALANAGATIPTNTQYNVVIGYNAGTAYDSGESSNILINNVGVEGESNVCRIGAATGSSTQQLNATYIAGIQGITVTGVPVLVSASDQLGIAVSSARFKDNIQDMEDASSPILNLRPVMFTYKGDSVVNPGLIAEEVAQVMPSLVVYDKEGLALTVKYHELPSLLLNELQKVVKRIDALERAME